MMKVIFWLDHGEVKTYNFYGTRNLCCDEVNVNFLFSIKISEKVNNGSTSGRFVSEGDNAGEAFILYCLENKHHDSAKEFLIDVY